MGYPVSGIHYLVRPISGIRFGPAGVQYPVQHIFGIQSSWFLFKPVPSSYWSWLPVPVLVLGLLEPFLFDPPGI